MQGYGTHAVIGVGQKEDPRVQKRKVHPSEYQMYAYCPGCKETRVFTIPLGVPVDRFACPNCHELLKSAW
jgi:hypothetical protein